MFVDILCSLGVDCEGVGVVDVGIFICYLVGFL